MCCVDQLNSQLEALAGVETGQIDLKGRSMTTDRTNKTGEANSRLWGARAADWANIQERQCRAVYLAAFDRVNIGSGISY